jgi:hypothetical protein
MRWRVKQNKASLEFRNYGDTETELKNKIQPISIEQRRNGKVYLLMMQS